MALASCAPTEPEGLHTEGLARIAGQLHDHNDDAEAVDFYTRAIQHAPKDASIRKSLADILEAHGDNASAAQQYSEALKIEPDNVEFLRSYGRVLLKAGHPTEAKEAYQRALQIEPDNIKSINGLGVSLDYLGNHEAAQTVYKKALDQRSDDNATLANLGHSYVLSGAWTQAIELLEPHLNDRDATPALRQNLAEAYGMAGMDADAERVARMDLSPDQVRHNLAYYRNSRTHLSAEGLLIADLGHFPTEAMAEANLDNMRQTLGETLDGLVAKVTPVIKEIGGTPSFAIYITGFSKQARLHTFCDKLKKQGIECTPRSDL